MSDFPPEDSGENLWYEDEKEKDPPPPPPPPEDPPGDHLIERRLPSGGSDQRLKD